MLISVVVLISCIIYASCQSVTVQNAVISKIDSRFIGAGEEMWDYLEILNFLTKPQFRYLSSQLGPGVLRVGGITCDFVKYVLPSSETVHVDQPTISIKKRNVQGFWPDYEKNLTIAEFETLVDYAKVANLELLFDLNEIEGRNCHVNGTTRCVGNWDTTNVRQFLTYLKDRQIGPIFGFELGNELTRSGHITMQENINDYITLNNIVNSIWTSPTGRPPIYGPSTDICDNTVVQFMSQTKSFLAGFTYHSYPANSGSQLTEQLTSADWLKNNIILKDTHANSIFCIQTWKSIGEPIGMKLWLTETNSAFAEVNGGMNAFLNGFWYLSSLGQYAQTGLSLHSRWALHGGTFGFIETLSNGKMNVLPDYWIAVLHKRLIGTNVLAVSDVPSQLLFYAHCGKTKGSVVLIFVNPNNQTHSVTVNGLSSQVPRDEYVLTADSLSSPVPKLNGVPLELTASGTLPSFYVKRVTSGGLVLEPRSYGFINFFNAGFSSCQ